LSISLSIPLSIPKPTMKSTKILLLLEEEECIVDLRQTATTIFKHLVSMGLSKDISFAKF